MRRQDYSVGQRVEVPAVDAFTAWFGGTIRPYGQGVVTKIEQWHPRVPPMLTVELDSGHIRRLGAHLVTVLNDKEPA